MSTTAREKFNTLYSSKFVLPGKCIALNSFAEYRLESLFINMGLKEFLEINYYPQLVHIFYVNLTIDQNNVIHSMVGGVDVSLSVEDLAHILVLSNEGYYLYKNTLIHLMTTLKESHVSLLQCLFTIMTIIDSLLMIRFHYSLYLVRFLLGLSCSTSFQNLGNMVKVEGVSLSCFTVS